MKIGILTSSRADYGIYLPLLKALKDDSFFELYIIAFGTHLSPFHGHTIDQILNDGFNVSYTIESLISSDSANAISTAMALTSLKFADFWKEHHEDYDLVFCLGDRYEMFSAVSAGIPYGIKFAHLHGGERTLGAIDNIFRHSISLASSVHFVATHDYGERVIELMESNQDVHVVGALSLDNLNNLSLLSIGEFKESFNIDLLQPTILCTFHPETVLAHRNIEYASIVSETLKELSTKYQVVITLPNADTEGSKIRQAFLKLPHETNNKVICVENFGTLGYFSCMKYCSFLLGNTSSGIIEAASFGKMVINIGNRQKGRACSNNVAHIPINKESIFEAVSLIEHHQCTFEGKNLYDQEGAVRKIVKVLKGNN
jgi:GDP/UDP-N,N'-diacetylbacillosamine 2-epimerase (hydrolysing)